MNAHIVWHNPAEEKILARLGRTLADQTGWSFGPSPDARAEVNIFMLYIDYAQRFSDWHRTKTAAYFSHHEPNSVHKTLWWEMADQLIDIKLLTAPIYAPLVHGQVGIITPPIEPGLFSISQRLPTQKLTVGVSGFVDPKSGRKGEHLVRELMRAFPDVEFVSSGQGWPVKRINKTLTGIGTFYHNIDIFLCASTIEGIPMPPLEALRSGVPTIIPWNVGMLDTLEDHNWLKRFEADNYDNLADTLTQMLALYSNGEGPSRGELSYLTYRFTPEAFANSVQAALLERPAPNLRLKKGKKVKGDAPLDKRAKKHDFSTDKHGKRGVLYVAYGDPARRCAAGSIDSLRGHMPDVEVAVVGTEPLGNEDIFVEYPDEDIGGRSPKTQIYDLAPKDWQYIMYLDADTEIVAPVYFLYKLLDDGWDMVICKNPGKFHIAREMKRSDNGHECDVTFRKIGSDEIIQLNGGVFTFQRNARTAAFFRAWHEEWLKFGKRDQAALLRALWDNPVKLYVLTNHWNTITRYDEETSTAGILHYPMTARRWRGVVHERSDSPEAWKKVTQ